MSFFVNLLSDSQESLDETEATQKEQHGKQTDKSKEIGRKIFSGPKKVEQKQCNFIKKLHLIF